MPGPELPMTPTFDAPEILRHVLRDVILGLREVNDAIQHEKDRTERIVASIADGVFTVDRDLMIRSFSPAMERLTGVAADQAIGRRCAEVLHGTKCAGDCPMRWTLDRRAPVERCGELFRPSGESLPVSVTTSVLTDAAGADMVVGIVQDRSEIERLRRELAALQALDEASDGAPLPAAQAEDATAGGDSQEALLLRRTLEIHRWNASRAARTLGISRTTLWRRMRRHGLMDDCRRAVGAA